MKNFDHDIMWLTLENIVILCVICFLVWLTGSGWWILLAFFMNTTGERYRRTSIDKAADNEQ